MEQKGELPPGRTVVTSSNNSFRDPDIEIELNELRQKRKNF
jgi:phage shock protein A